MQADRLDADTLFHLLAVEGDQAARDTPPLTWRHPSRALLYSRFSEGKIRFAVAMPLPARGDAMMWPSQVTYAAERGFGGGHFGGFRRAGVAAEVVQAGRFCELRIAGSTGGSRCRRSQSWTLAR